MKKYLTEKNLSIASIVLMAIALFFGYKFYLLYDYDASSLQGIADLFKGIGELVDNVFYNLIFVGLVFAAYVYSAYVINKDKPKSLPRIIAYGVITAMLFYAYTTLKKNVDFDLTGENLLEDLSTMLDSQSSALENQYNAINSGITVYILALVLQFVAGIPSLISVIKEQRSSEVSANVQNVEANVQKKVSPALPKTDQPKQDAQDTEVSSMPPINKNMPKIPNMPNIPGSNKSGSGSIQESMINSIKGYDYQGKANQYQDQVKNYLNTEKGSKNFRLGALAVTAAIVLFAVVKLFGAMTAPTVDLTENCELSVQGSNGEGAAYAACSINTEDLSLNVLQQKTINGIRWEISPEKDLSNGDTVKVVAKYDKKKLKKAGIRVKNKEKTMKVKGLKDTYKKYESVPKEDREAMDEAALELIELKYQQDYDKFISIEDTVLVAKYYTYDEANNGKVRYVYHVTSLMEGYDDGTKLYDDYVACEFSNLSPEEELVTDFSSPHVFVNIDVYSGDSTYNDIIRMSHSNYDEEQLEVIEEKKGDFKINQNNDY